MIQDTLTRLLADAASVAASDLGLDRAEIPTPELLKPRLKEHGDWSSNIALVLAPQVGRAPREVAESLAARIPTDDLILRVEVAGPGFINLFLSDRWLHDLLAEILERCPNYGREQPDGKRVQVDIRASICATWQSRSRVTSAIACWTRILPSAGTSSCWKPAGACSTPSCRHWPGSAFGSTRSRPRRIWWTAAKWQRPSSDSGRRATPTTPTEPSGSGPPTSVTTRTACSSVEPANRPTSPRTARTCWTRPPGGSIAWSTCGGPITTAT